MGLDLVEGAVRMRMVESGRRAHRHRRQRCGGGGEDARIDMFPNWGMGER